MHCFRITGSRYCVENSRIFRENRFTRLIVTRSRSPSPDLTSPGSVKVDQIARRSRKSFERPKGERACRPLGAAVPLARGQTESVSIPSVGPPGTAAHIPRSGGDPSNPSSSPVTRRKTAGDISHDEGTVLATRGRRYPGCRAAAPPYPRGTSFRPRAPSPVTRWHTCFGPNSLTQMRHQGNGHLHLVSGAPGEMQGPFFPSHLTQPVYHCGLTKVIQ